eukprot:9487943-Pyramimonas_sp.AAC.1
MAQLPRLICVASLFPPRPAPWACLAALFHRRASKSSAGPPMNSKNSWKPTMRQPLVPAKGMVHSSASSAISPPR